MDNIFRDEYRDLSLV